MKLFLLIAALAVALFTVECRLQRNDEDVSGCLSGDVHDYLDKVLLKAREELDDPMRLPPRSSVVELSDGVLWGLSNITRLGDAEVHCEGSNIVIKAKITTDELKGRYTWTRERKNKSPWEGYVVFISDDFQAEVEVVIERKEGEQTHPQLDRFEIKKFKDARIEMTGLGFFTWALGEMTTLMSGIFQRAIAAQVQGPLREALERELRTINIE